MTQKQIRNRNEIISSFMGYIKIPWKFRDSNFGFIKKEDLTKYPNIEGWAYNSNLFWSIIWDFKYHSSWDQLIPACQKWDTLKINAKNQLKYEKLSDVLDNAVTCYDILPVFEQLVNNIKWYNGLETGK